MSSNDTKARQLAALATPTDLQPNATRDLSAELTTLLSDVFALYLKTKNFHWHMSGPHFRDYHLLLDEQGRPDFRHRRTTSPSGYARSAARPCARSARSRRSQRVLDNDAEYVDAAGHAGRVARGQQAIVGAHARDARAVRRIRRRRDREPARELDRRSRKAGRGSCSKRRDAAKTAGTAWIENSTAHRL